MLPARYRWSLRRDQAFFSQARRLKTAVGLIYFLPSAAGFQATVITPKHSFRRAIDRHVAKRRLAGVLKLLVDEHKTPAAKVVIVPTRQVLTADSQPLKTALAQSLSQVK